MMQNIIIEFSMDVNECNFGRAGKLKREGSKANFVIMQGSCKQSIGALIMRQLRAETNDEKVPWLRQCHCRKVLPDSLTSYSFVMAHCSG